MSFNSIFNQSDYYETYYHNDEAVPMDCSDTEGGQEQEKETKPAPEIIYLPDEEGDEQYSEKVKPIRKCRTKIKEEPKDDETKEEQPKPKYRKKTISLPVRSKVWNTYIGEYCGKSKCMCCGDVDISPFHFECGHVVSEKNGGDVSIENLRPICSGCNKSMNKTNMIEYMQKNKLQFPNNWFGVL